jgi:hypothetical protein
MQPVKPSLNCVDEFELTGPDFATIEQQCVTSNQLQNLTCLRQPRQTAAALHTSSYSFAAGYKIQIQENSRTKIHVHSILRSCFDLTECASRLLLKLA